MLAAGVLAAGVLAAGVLAAGVLAAGVLAAGRVPLFTRSLERQTLSVDNTIATANVKRP
jgi:hypothetical protein